MKRGGAAALCAAASLVAVARGSRAHLRPGESALVQRLQRYRNASLLKGGEAEYGSVGCPCIGVDKIAGTQGVVYEGKKLVYPADLGARCGAWERCNHPDCRGADPPGWCLQSWCYVDPCNCDLDVPPKPSFYMRSGRYQGRPIHYSYATCNGKDEWSTDKAKVEAQRADNEELCARAPDAARWGSENCRCIGIAGHNGTVEVGCEGKRYAFPADVGAHCRAWEAASHPDCQKEQGAPDWCRQPWCYVDPCSCHLETPSKASVYLPEAKYQGKPIHFSYATCGGTDSWSTYEIKALAKKNNEICAEAEHVAPAPTLPAPEPPCAEPVAPAPAPAPCPPCQRQQQDQAREAAAEGAAASLELPLTALAGVAATGAVSLL